MLDYARSLVTTEGHVNPTFPHLSTCFDRISTMPAGLLGRGVVVLLCFGR